MGKYRAAPGSISQILSSFAHLAFVTSITRPLLLCHVDVFLVLFPFDVLFKAPARVLLDGQVVVVPPSRPSNQSHLAAWGV
jgi:hypothetical protein